MMLRPARRRGRLRELVDVHLEPLDPLGEAVEAVAELLQAILRRVGTHRREHLARDDSVQASLAAATTA